MKIRKILEALTGIAFGIGTYYVSDFIFRQFFHDELYLILVFIFVTTFALLGYLVSPELLNLIKNSFLFFFNDKILKLSIHDYVAGASGLVVGLVIANLLSYTLKGIYLGQYFSLVVACVLGYLGMMIAVRKREDLIQLFQMLGTGVRHKKKAEPAMAIDIAKGKLLDTSVIIDGRIADICQTNFIEGALIVPQFVLEELQLIADSADLLKRNRGRRGLDILNKLRNDFPERVVMVEKDYPQIEEVDAKLVKLAIDTNSHILTNDYNLNKVAQFQEVVVLNINELANSIKPALLPGETLKVKVVKPGKEEGQGLAYLDDGTMIVVENGQEFIEQEKNVIVTSALQTSAGKMIFARIGDE